MNDKLRDATHSRTALLEAIASAWCVPPNENKIMDPDLANTIADQVIGLRWLQATPSETREPDEGYPDRKDLRIEQLEKQLVELRGMHKQMCDVAVERFNEIERLRAIPSATRRVKDPHAKFAYGTREEPHDKPSRLFVRLKDLTGGTVIATTYPFEGGEEYALVSATLEPTPTELDLAMAVRRVCARLKLRSQTGPHATADLSLVDSILGLLKRKGLEGSPLRDEPRWTNGDEYVHSSAAAPAESNAIYCDRSDCREARACQRLGGCERCPVKQPNDINGESK